MAPYEVQRVQNDHAQALAQNFALPDVPQYGADPLMSFSIIYRFAQLAHPCSCGEQRLDRKSSRRIKSPPQNQVGAPQPAAVGFNARHVTPSDCSADQFAYCTVDHIALRREKSVYSRSSDYYVRVTQQ